MKKSDQLLSIFFVSPTATSRSFKIRSIINGILIDGKRWRSRHEVSWNEGNDYLYSHQTCLSYQISCFHSPNVYHRLALKLNKLAPTIVRLHWPTSKMFNCFYERFEWNVSHRPENPFFSFDNNDLNRAENRTFLQTKLSLRSQLQYMKSRHEKWYFIATVTFYSKAIHLGVNYTNRTRTTSLLKLLLVDTLDNLAWSHCSSLPIRMLQ